MVALCLDDFVASGGPAPDVIKIDVEGAESEVLKGAVDILQTRRPALIVKVHTADEHAAVSQILDDTSYTVRWNTPPEGFPRQCLAAPRGSPLHCPPLLQTSPSPTEVVSTRPHGSCGPGTNAIASISSYLRRFANRGRTSLR